MYIARSLRLQKLSGKEITDKTYYLSIFFYSNWWNLMVFVAVEGFRSNQFYLEIYIRKIYRLKEMTMETIQWRKNLRDVVLILNGQGQGLRRNSSRSGTIEGIRNHYYVPDSTIWLRITKRTNGNWAMIRKGYRFIGIV